MKFGDWSMSGLGQVSEVGWRRDIWERLGVISCWGAVWTPCKRLLCYWVGLKLACWGWHNWHHWTIPRLQTCSKASANIEFMNTLTHSRKSSYLWVKQPFHRYLNIPLKLLFFEVILSRWKTIYRNILVFWGNASTSYLEIKGDKNHYI